MQNVALFRRIRIHIYFCDTVPLKACVKVLRNGLTPLSLILQGIDSEQYHSAGRLTQCSMILHEVNLEKLNLLGEILTKIENI